LADVPESNQLIVPLTIRWQPWRPHGDRPSIGLGCQPRGARPSNRVVTSRMPAYPLQCRCPHGQHAGSRRSPPGQLCLPNNSPSPKTANALRSPPKALRAVVKRHRLPPSRSNDGKTLAAIALKEIRHKPIPARSPRGHRSATAVVATLKARIAELETELSQA